MVVVENDCVVMMAPPEIGGRTERVQSVFFLSCIYGLGWLYWWRLWTTTTQHCCCMEDGSIAERCCVCTFVSNFVAFLFCRLFIFRYIYFDLSAIVYFVICFIVAFHDCTIEMNVYPPRIWYDNNKCDSVVLFVVVSLWSLCER